eukprot:TRINITY_DN2613_c0_g2_i1.p1 TRINITY_DN2613_c0_g2~~TRINITY_DN2613_c0_g2_i1.p1  ORF type:complete len:302 (+),score=49.76 TRINITY_DN2613_c0_g2_i1:89-994(+)
MDKLITTIHGLSGEDGEVLQQLQKALTKDTDLIVKNRHNIGDVFSLLDYNKHSLGILHLLANWCLVPKYDRQDFIQKTILFLNQCSEVQIKVDPGKFALVCHKLVENCRETNQAIRAVRPLLLAISKIAPAEHITPQHADFVLACILAKTYKVAIPILDRFDYKIDPNTTAVKGEHVRLFLFYGGICYISQKQYSKALQYFENVISAPAYAVSAIMVEAYKKYLLVSLIHLGEVRSLPRYTTPSVTRLCKELCIPYEELCNAFSVRSVQDIEKVVNNHHQVFFRFLFRMETLVLLDKLFLH